MRAVLQVFQGNEVRLPTRMEVRLFIESWLYFIAMNVR